MRAIVFDLDGTLVDSLPDIAAAANAMLGDLGRTPLDPAVIRGFIGNGVARLVERCLAATGGPPGEADALGRFRIHYDAAPATRTVPYPGAEAAMAALARAGHPLALCTNKPEAPARAILASFGWQDLFATVVGGDTTPALKPDPAPLFAALDGVGAAPGRALLVGDSETDAATAAAARAPFALFTEGYRKAPVEVIAARFAFARFDDLPALVAALPPVDAV